MQPFPSLCGACGSTNVEVCDFIEDTSAPARNGDLACIVRWVCNACKAVFEQMFTKKELWKNRTLSIELNKIRLMVMRKKEFKAVAERAKDMYRYRTGYGPSPPNFGEPITRETATGKSISNLPPYPGDELSTEEWMRLREGRPSKEEEATATESVEKMKAERSRQEQMLKTMQSQQSAQLKAMEIQLRQQQVQGMQNIYGGQAKQGLGGLWQSSSFPYQSPWDILAEPPKQAKPKTPKKPDTTPEEAERKLTAVGQRKIICDEGK